jgi:hypothetical protein
MFGPVSGDMFGAIGRVVAIASLVEMNAVDLITLIDDLIPMIDGESRTDTAGKSIPEVLNERNQAKKPALPADVIALLNEVTDVQNERHAVAHGLWTVSLDGSTFLWRPVVERKRTAPHIPTVGDVVTMDYIRMLIKRLVDLSDRLKSRQTMIGALSIPQEMDIAGRP